MLSVLYCIGRRTAYRKKLDSQANIYRNVFIFRSFLFFFYKSICVRASFDTALPRILSRSLEMDGTVLKSMIRSLFSSRSPFIVSLLNSAFYNRRLTISPTLQTDALLSSFPAGSRFSDIHTHTHADSSSTHIQSRLAVLICCCRFLPKKILRPAPYIHYPLVLLFSLFLSLSLAFVL